MYSKTLLGTSSHLTVGFLDTVYLMPSQSRPTEFWSSRCLLLVQVDCAPLQHCSLDAQLYPHYLFNTDLSLCVCLVKYLRV